MMVSTQELTTISFEEAEMQTTKTTRTGLKERQDTPLVLPSSEEPFNSKSLETNSNVNSPVENSKPCSHLGSGYYSRNMKLLCNFKLETARQFLKRGGLSAHNVFVLGIDRKPLTPTTNAKARKLIRDKQAIPLWNKFNQFGIQMLVETRKEMPKTALGVDFGTKFEGYTVVVGKENNLSVMWKLPNKKKIVRKLEKRRQLRRTRRHRNCRRRECRFDNRNKEGLIAPSQLVMVQSRLKAIKEFFRCYPIDAVALEDVKFNHRYNKWGENFSTIEIGKKIINDWIKQRACLQMFSGMDTEDCRERYGYKKSSNKSAEIFNSHCSDALALATEIYAQQHIEIGTFLIADDTYRSVRRRLHDTQFSKSHIRYPYSSGNFKGIRKGTICQYGQIVGGTKNNVWIRNQSNKRIGRNVKRLDWLSKHFKINGGWQFCENETFSQIENALHFQLLPTLTDGVSLPY